MILIENLKNSLHWKNAFRLVLMKSYEISMHLLKANVAVVNLCKWRFSGGPNCKSEIRMGLRMNREQGNPRVCEAVCRNPGQRSHISWMV